MTTLLYIEIEHTHGAILSAAVGNISGPFFLAHVSIKEKIPPGNLSAYLRKLEKEDEENYKAENLHDNKESLKHIFI